MDPIIELSNVQVCHAKAQGIHLKEEHTHAHSDSLMMCSMTHATSPCHSMYGALCHLSLTYTFQLKCCMRHKPHLWFMNVSTVQQRGFLL